MLYYNYVVDKWDKELNGTQTESKLSKSDKQLISQLKRKYWLYKRLLQMPYS